MHASLSEETNTLTGRNDILHAFAQILYPFCFTYVCDDVLPIFWRWREGTGYELGFRLNNKDDWPGP